MPPVTSTDQVTGVPIEAAVTLAKQAATRLPEFNARTGWTTVC